MSGHRRAAEARANKPKPPKPKSKSKTGGGKAAKRRVGKRKTGSGKGPSTRPPIGRPDPSDTEDAEVRYIQPYQATKAYLCPGCNRDIPAGMGHMVVVPPDAPDLRRHWHRGCWTNRRTRR